ncbi:MAG: amidohydrolase [Anaerolineales bacterium]|nr:amidohydrolase [Anaerolineales bacterium]
MTLLLQNAAYVVRAADRIEKNCDVLIQGNLIAAVGKITPAPEWELINAAGHAVIPGLVNAHTHLYQNFLKGLNDGVPLVEWCAEVLYPATDVIHSDHWDRHDERMGYAWSMLGALEMIKSGTTACINMDVSMDAIYQAWQDIGFRGVGAITQSDQWIPDKLRRAPEISRQAALGYIERWAEFGPRIQIVLAPSTPFLASADLLRWTREQRDQLGVGVQIHVSETRYEVDTILKESGTTPLRYLDKFGLLDEKLTAVHCVHLDEGELDLLGERGVIPIYNPKSNMKLGSGIAPITGMLHRGITVALANDGSASNDLLDMFEEMRCAALLQKVAAENPSVISAGDVFRMATENGAKACRINAGTIDPGRLADIAIINLRKPHLLPVHDIMNSLVYCAKGEDVETTIIDGRVIMQNRKLLTLDEDFILDQAEKWGTDLSLRSRKSELYPQRNDQAGAAKS